MTVEEIKDELRKQIEDLAEPEDWSYSDGKRDAYIECLEWLENVTL